jgi:peroxiredoxin
MLRFVLLGFVLLRASVGFAGEFNEVLKVGDPAPAWKDLPGVDDKQHSLADHDKDKVIVVVFTCNSCPVARDYEARTIELAKRHAKQVDVVAINCNRTDEDSLDKMRERAKDKKYTHQYLFDESQRIAKEFGATRTPEFFVLSRDRKIVYMGAMDDSAEPAKVMANYVEDAVQASLAKREPATKETFANGCRIRFARERPERK